LSCFDENIALQFVQGLLGAEEAREVERHAAHCAECRWLLAAAAGATTGETPTLDEGGQRPAGTGAIGDLLAGDYRLGRLIGSGGMGTVYEASHARLPRRFALKLLVESLHASPEAVVRLRREAEITSRLSHPHIVQVLDFNTTERGVPFVVMELLEGESLSALLRRERVVRSVETLAAILEQATSALGAAHAQGVVHRDLKPNNLFLCATDDDRVHLKVMDFGISKVMGSTTELTRDAAVLGSPGYMSPEQARGESSEVDPRADIFSMGAIIFRMLAGRGAFAGGSVPATLYQVVHESPTPTPEWRRVPRPLQRAVLRALSKRPAARQQSMDELWEELQGALRACGQPPVKETGASPGSPRSGSGSSLTWMLPPGRRTRLLYVATGVAAVVVLAALALAIQIARSPSPTSGPRAPEIRGSARSSPASAPGSAPGSPPGSPDAKTIAVAGLLDGSGPADARRGAPGTARRPRRRRHGWLTVQSKSTDGRYLWAEVWVDGRPVGKTPLLGRRLRAGTHRIQLRRKGYRAASRRVVLRPGEREVVSLVLRPAADTRR
jgi:serine/threonine-protein kinase